MTDVFWPGDERAGALFGTRAFVRAMIEVEAAWSQALVETGIAPAAAADPSAAGSAAGSAAALADLVEDSDLPAILLAAEGGANPVIALTGLLRERLVSTDPTAAAWLHRGLTSQDVVDTALMLATRDVLDRVEAELADQVGALRGLIGQHRHTLMAGRTLTQFAVPVTFGLRAAGWLQGLLDAAEILAAARAGLRAQFGGAAGTMAATSDLAARAGLPDPAGVARATATAAADRLTLAAATPWHTTRAPLTRVGDALTSCTDAWGHIATDVITLSRPELGELSEPAAAGRGASSTMPQKRNPVLSVLIRRAALSAPMLAAQLHLAAADTGDERPAGAWHTEWAALATLARRTVIAAAQTSEVLAGLQVDPERMLATVTAAGPGLIAERLVPTLAEAVTGSGEPLGRAGARDLVLAAADLPALQKALADLLPADGLAQLPTDLFDPGAYLGSTNLFIDDILTRTQQRFPQENR